MNQHHGDISVNEYPKLCTKYIVEQKVGDLGVVIK